MLRIRIDESSERWFELALRCLTRGVHLEAVPTARLDRLKREAEENGLELEAERGDAGWNVEPVAGHKPPRSRDR